MLCSEVTDYPGGFVIVNTDFGRMHLFASEAREEILRKIQAGLLCVLFFFWLQFLFFKLSKNLFGKLSLMILYIKLKDLHNLAIDITLRVSIKHSLSEI